MARKRSTRPPGRPACPDILTPAEQRVLEQLRLGLPYAEIAVRLGISVNGVKYHVSNMLGKLGLADRHQLARWRPEGRESGWKSRALAVLVAKWTAGTAITATAVAGGVFAIGPVFSGSQPTPMTAAVITVGYDGSPVDGESMRPVVSGNGRYVVYTSTATNLVPGDTNGKTDVFLYDRDTGVTTRVSVGPNGELDGDSDNPAISADGRYIVFDSYATNAGPPRPPLPAADVARFRAALDRPDGELSWTAPEHRELVFQRLTSATFPARQVFLHDTQTGQTTQLSLSPSGEGANHHAFAPTISADGRYVAFSSVASNLVPGDTNLGVDGPSQGLGAHGSAWSLGGADVFVFDRREGHLRRVSLGVGGSEAQGDSVEPVISPDGRWVYFLSDAPNLVPGQQEVRIQVGRNGSDPAPAVTPVPGQPFTDPGGAEGDALVWTPLMMPFVHDLRAGTTAQVPLPPETDAYSRIAVSNLGAVVETVEHPGGNRRDPRSAVYWYTPGRATLEPLPAGPLLRAPGGACSPALSAGGRLLATCLWPPEGVGLFDDRAAAAHRLVTGSTPRLEGEYHKTFSISADGDVVAVELRGLPPGQRWSSSDIYLVAR